MSKGTGLFVVAMVAILLIAGIGSVFAEDPAALLTQCGAVLVTLTALLRVQVQTHDAVNSKMDRLLGVVEREALGRGERVGREKQRNENHTNVLDD